MDITITIIDIDPTKYIKIRRKIINDIIPEILELDKELDLKEEGGCYDGYAYLDDDDIIENDKDTEYALDLFWNNIQKNENLLKIMNLLSSKGYKYKGKFVPHKDGTTTKDSKKKDINIEKEKEK